MTAVAVERLTINGPAGGLEAVLEEPRSDPQGGDPVGGGRFAVLCHPHPSFGGTMDNKVVTTLGRAMHDLGVPSLRFNFRGVGASQGSFDAGVGETDDAQRIAEWGASRWPRRTLIIAGFSFGAYVALRLAQRLPASHLVTIAPPVAMFDFSSLHVPACPWLVVQGDADDVVDPRRVIGWVDELVPRPKLARMPGAGHFFHGRLVELRGIVTDAVRGG
jgi:alpha/beta superfamily hydrolase